MSLRPSLGHPTNWNRRGRAGVVDSCSRPDFLEQDGKLRQASAATPPACSALSGTTARRARVCLAVARYAGRFVAACPGRRHNACIAPADNSLARSQILLLSGDDETPAAWKTVVQEGRTDYADRRAHLLRFIEHPEALAELSIDPLADDPDVSRHRLSLPWQRLSLLMNSRSRLGILCAKTR